MFDFLHEILATIRRNKMRTALTGFAVVWGIFMLIVLLGAGNGLRNGVMSNFGGQMFNTIFISPGRTSVAYGGYQAGRRYTFDVRDAELLRREIPELTYLSGGRGRNLTFTYGDQSMSCYCDGVAPGEQYLFDIDMYRGWGRYINAVDTAARRKVVVLGNYAAEQLFGRDVDPTGRWVEADGTAFQVVGVYDDEYNEGNAYIPVTTAQMLYFGGWGYTRIGFSVGGLDTEAEIEAFDRRVRRIVAAAHHFDPEDRSALYVNNRAEGALQMRKAFTGVRIFVWIIGIASMMAGIVGVGNIMLITVKERTREIGIRKAIGATPRSILKLIIFEAIFIMTASGYVGILLGIGLTELVSSLLAGGGDVDGVTMFADPTVDMGTVLAATLFLIACGTVAGLIPALKATRVRPIEAMRAE